MDPRQLHQMQQGIGAAHAAVKSQDKRCAQIEQQIAKINQDFNMLAEQVKVTGPAGSPGSVEYIENIPGRRIPFDLTVNIPVGANITNQQEASVVISQNGPFVAVARFAIFQSAFEFSIEDENGNTSSFQGRSYGRYRPIHSAWDLNDSQVINPVVGQANPGTGDAIYAAPTNHSSFRSMQFDGTVEFENEGAAYPRQNTRIPSAFYTSQINTPFNLAALDFFERGETLKWKVTPLHANNPDFGNVFGFDAGGFYPFSDSQYDVHEGVLDPVVADQESDPATRLPNGIMVIGFHGYRIIQPPGSVSLT